MNAIEKTYNFLKEAGTFYYASVENGQARVRPFGFTMVIDGKLYFGMGKHKASYQESVDNPYIEICSCKGREWIRIRGRAVFDWSEDVIEKIFAANPFLKQKYGSDSDLTHAQLYLEDMSVEYFTMDGAQEKWV